MRRIFREGFGARPAPSSIRRSHQEFLIGLPAESRVGWRSLEIAGYPALSTGKDENDEHGANASGVLR